MAQAAARTNHPIDPPLAAKAKVLLESPYFVVDDGGAGIAEKQLIFYVLAGVKPAAEVGSFHMEELSPGYLESRPDNQEAVATLLGGLGLSYSFRQPYDGIATVSLHKQALRDRENINQLADEAEIYRAYGRLYGYPQSAVDAFVAEYVHGRSELMTVEEQTEIEQRSGLPKTAFLFRFSKAHWADALETVRRWHSTLVPYDDMNG